MEDRIENAKNRVFYSKIGVGKDDPISLHTSPTSIYRVTGMSQVADIINCGYVRPKKGYNRGGHKNEVFWSIGGDKLFYFDKNPVLETSIDKVKDGQIGSLSISDLSAIWIFDYEQNKYLDRKNHIDYIREISKSYNTVISEEQLEQMLFQLSNQEQLDNTSHKSR